MLACMPGSCSCLSVWELSWDPFKRMAKEGTAYAYLDKGTNFLNYLGKLVFDYLDQHPEVRG